MAKDFLGDDQQKTRTKFKTILVAIIVIVVIIVIIVALVVGYLSKDERQSNDWQAVFLGDGQVYFGKIVSQTKRDLKLEDIYYLNKAITGQDVNSQQEFTLVKLGNEIHGPDDEMIINRDYVVLTERLKDDSRVVQSINSFIADQER